MVKKIDWTKAKRKSSISSRILGYSYYDNLHQYSKNKIHCSCPLCRRGKGAFDNSFDKLSNKDKRKISSMKEEEQEYGIC